MRHMIASNAFPSHVGLRSVRLPNFVFVVVSAQVPFCRCLSALQSCVMHKVYRGRFTTLRGTERAYVGTTRCIEVREGFWRADPPGFKKAASVAEGFAVEVLEAGIESHAVALVLEALHAARSIMKSPYTARGGPWSSMRSLTAAALEDVRAVAKCRTLMAVHDVAQSRKGSALWRHVKNLRFARPSEAPTGMPVTRGACVWTRKKSGRSGPSGASGRSGASQPGNAKRLNLVLHHGLKRGSVKHDHLHRGVKPVERRRLETIRRKNRN